MNQPYRGPISAPGSENASRVVSEVSRSNPTSNPPSHHQEEENLLGDCRRTDNAATADDLQLSEENMPRLVEPLRSRSETNPFKRKPVPVDFSQDNQNTDALSVPPTNAPPPSIPTDSLSNLHISEPGTSTNPWQPALNEISNGPHPALPLSDHEPKSNVWDSGVLSRDPTSNPALDSPTRLPLNTEQLQPWVHTSPPKSSPSSLPRASDETERMCVNQHARSAIESRNMGEKPDVHASQIQSQTVDDWNLIDHEPMQETVSTNLSKTSTRENLTDGSDGKFKKASASASATVEVPPSLPPRRVTKEDLVAQSSRPLSSSVTSKSETYQIKNIHWLDMAASGNPRKSPILVQNANGPCPLVALVNALTLTTPANQANSNLVETLRSREQISLNFLLEAVFDELMTHRHTNPEVSLPDMTELYSFLKSLHTGMNVNPRFVPDSQDPLTSSPSYSPGTFETTRDMMLYATFSIPLIHGWLPPKEDPAYDSFTRQASSYDDVQSILFREEELEYKLSNSDTGLTEQEQQLYQDIIIIKSFLEISATQLTPWGLEVIAHAIPPGRVAILFRNDHFSTLYRHPQTKKLFTLVTDAGYYTHDEIVWESLVDVRGECTEFFSGDFRIVSGPQQQRPSGANTGAWYAGEGSNRNASSSASAHDTEWQVVQPRHSQNPGKSEPDPSTSLSPKHEQEDRDLALALQLQEEEEERHRSEQAARRRESQLSEQFIEQQGRQGTPIRGNQGRGSAPIPPVRGSSANHSTSTVASASRPVQQVRSLIPPVSATHRPGDNNVDDAPPSYEQASKTTPYVPPAGHPSHPESSPRNATSHQRSATTGQSNVSSSMSGRGRPGGPPLPASGASAQAGGGREKDCIVM